MAARDKILTLERLPEWREAVRRRGAKLVVTNGCFDLLHAGHVTYLEQARERGDLLLVGLNGDQSVRQLKGPERPYHREADRALLLAALAAVDAVCIFPQVEATEFLKRAAPDIYVKGGDYTPETLNPHEVEAVGQAGGKIVIVPLVPGLSSSAVITKIRASG